MGTSAPDSVTLGIGWVGVDLSLRRRAGAARALCVRRLRRVLPSVIAETLAYDRSAFQSVGRPPFGLQSGQSATSLWLPLTRMHDLPLSPSRSAG